MKKIFYMIALMLILFSVFCTEAKGVDVEEEQAKALAIDELEKNLPEDAQDTLDGVTVTDSLEPDSGLKRLYERAGEEIGGILKNAVRSAVAILAIAIFCSIAASICDTGGKGPDYIVLVGVLAVSVAVFGDVHSFVGLGKTVLDDLNTFSKVLLPTLTAAATGSGAVTSAAAKYAVTVLFLDILITIANNVVMPLIYAYIAAAAAKAAFGGPGLDGAANLIKWIITVILTGMMLAFTLYLTLTGIISGTADATATKLTKTVISAALPVVGSIISDAAGTVVSGMSVLKNAIGIFGLLAVCATCLIPFLKLGIHYLIYKAAAALTATIADDRISKFVSSIGTAFGMTLGLSGASALMLFFSILSVLKAVVAA